jgi:hypothetical protein
MLARTMRNVPLIHVTRLGALKACTGKTQWWLIGLSPGPMYKAMTKTPARHSAMPVNFATPDELLSFTTSILHAHDIESI